MKLNKVIANVKTDVCHLFYCYFLEIFIFIPRPIFLLFTEEDETQKKKTTTIFFIAIKIILKEHRHDTDDDEFVLN